MANQELEASIVDPSKEVDESEVNLKDELYKLKQQMAEMYQAWAKGHPPPTHDNQYYPLEPTFKVPEPYPYTPHLYLPAETEKPPKILEHEEMIRKVKSLEQSFRDMRELGGQVSVAYKDLCFFPDVQLPAGFKMTKFDLYDGLGDPVAQLRGFCSKIRGEGRRDELLMAYFSQNRLSLTKIKKDPGESFRKYGFRWREQAARVDPPMKESEMVDYFLQALEPTYFGHLVSVVGKSFNEVVKMGGMVEEGHKSNKIMSYSAIKTTTQAIQNSIGGVLGKEKKEDIATVELRQLGMLSPIEPKLPNPPPRNLDHFVSSEYCSGAPGHDIEKCWH
ncbi:uncharacterized protein [Nicotiana sylvestris]|uniref:uncharacterized protein n=1 Tax=Nicotiana sylvestris TaxID=4096 RepID=UPI00388C373A